MENSYQSAKYYDAFLYVFVRKIRKKVLQIVQENKYRKILDVCCGTGDQLKLLQKNGYNGVGIDLSPTMLNVAASGKIKAKCYEQDAENITFKNNSFDMTTTTFALHEKSTNTAKAILNEMIRLTKPNGDIIIVDFSIDDRTSFLSKGLIRLIESMAGDEHYSNFNNYVSNNGLKTLLNNLPLIEKQNYYFGLNGIVLKVLTKTS